jgi:uncharacterized protein
MINNLIYYLKWCKVFFRFSQCVLLTLVGCLFLSACSQHTENSQFSGSLTRSNTENFSFGDSPHIIALLIPLHGPLGTVGQAIKQGFVIAAQNSNMPPQIILIDTTGETSIQTAYSKAVAKRAEFVVGPLLKSQVQTLAGLELNVPLLALNYLSPGVSAPHKLYQFGLSPLDEAREAAHKAWQSGYRSPLIMTANGVWGLQIGQAFADEWRSLGGNVIDYLELSQKPSALTKQLKCFLRFKPPHERRTDFDVIFLASNAKIGRQIKPLLQFFYAGEIPVYATASIYSGLPNYLDKDLNHVIFCSSPWALGDNTVYPLLFEQLQAANAPIFFHYRSYYALGVDAFHIAQHLADLSQSTLQVLPGATGQLALDNQQRIVRHLPCAQFRNGDIVLLK